MMVAAHSEPMHATWLTHANMRYTLSLSHVHGGSIGELLHVAQCAGGCNAGSAPHLVTCPRAIPDQHAAGAGRLHEAAAAYEAAGDALAAVRAALAADPGKNSAAAAALALRMRSPAACAAVVQHCQATGEHAVRICSWVCAEEHLAFFAGTLPQQAFNACSGCAFG